MTATLQINGTAIVIEAKLLAPVYRTIAEIIRLNQQETLVFDSTVGGVPTKVGILVNSSSTVAFKVESDRVTEEMYAANLAELFDRYVNEPGTPVSEPEDTV